jgi:hypothetical protein
VERAKAALVFEGFHMSQSGLTIADAAASAAEFTRDAARRVWGAQALMAFGVALIFASLRGRMSPGDGHDLWRIGWWTVLVIAAPLWAGLYRLELGGAARRGLGPAGLQFGMAEIRLIVLSGAFLGATLFVWLPVVAVSALVFVLFRGAGEASLGLLGHVRVSFLIVTAIWLAALGGFAWACARAAFAPVATVGKRRLVAQEAWALGRGRVTTVLAAWTLAQAPAALALALLGLMDSMQLKDPVAGALGRWPLVDAAVGGAALGLVVAFLQLPLTVGVLGYLYRARRERARQLTVHWNEAEPLRFQRAI